MPNGFVIMKLDNLTFARIETECFNLQVLLHLKIWYFWHFWEELCDLKTRKNAPAAQQHRYRPDKN